MEDYNKKQIREHIYKLGKPLLGQTVSLAGAIAMFVIATKGLIKEDESLLYTGLIPCWIFMYSSYLYHKQFKSILNEHESKDKLSRLEQKLIKYNNKK